MNDNTIVIIGVFIGILFGISGIATLFDIFSGAITDTANQLATINTLSTLLLLVVAVILIVKIKIISSLIVGSIIGAVINILLKVNNIDIVNEVYNLVIKFMGL